MQRTLPRILFLNGIVDEKNTADLMCQIVNINAEDDFIADDTTVDFQQSIKDMVIVDMVDGYPVRTHLDDGTQLGLSLSNEVFKRPPITIHIKSSGGYVEHGMALINMIRTSNTPIHAVVHFGHSMAFAIASACDYRIGFPTSRMMIHDMSGGVSGTTEQLIRATENSKILRELADQVIIDNTKITQEMLDEMNNSVLDRYFTGQELLDYGLLDEIKEYSIPEHKQKELMNEATQRLIKEDKMEVIGGLADKLSNIRTRQMVIDEIYDLMDDDNIEEIERLLEVDNLDDISFDELEGYLEYIKDFSMEDPYDVF